MNKVRRNLLENIYDKLEEQKEEIQSVFDNEEEIRDNFPENLQNSEKFERSDTACDSLGTAIDLLEDALAEIKNAIDQ